MCFVFVFNFILLIFIFILNVLLCIFCFCLFHEMCVCVACCYIHTHDFDHSVTWGFKAFILLGHLLHILVVI